MNLRVRLLNASDKAVWRQLSHEYDRYVAVLQPDLKEWYDGNESSLPFERYMDAKIEQNEAFMVVDGQENGLGIVAVSTKHNRITFFAVSHRADFDSTAELLLKTALSKLNSEQDVSMNVVICDFPHIVKQREILLKFGLEKAGENRENGVPVEVFVRKPLSRIWKSGRFS